MDSPPGDVMPGYSRVPVALKQDSEKQTLLSERVLNSLVLPQHHSKAGVLHPGHFGVVPADQLSRGEHHLEVRALEGKTHPNPVKRPPNIMVRKETELRAKSKPSLVVSPPTCPLSVT